jgi:hypothetical protein
MLSSALWHTRPILVTSTFRDMQAERDWLRLRVFPAVDGLRQAKDAAVRLADLQSEVLGSFVS